MARRTNVDKGKESLVLLGVKVEPALKKAIEDEGDALGVAMSTYARQLLLIGWRSRHKAPIAQNPREQILTAMFNELPLGEQENVVAIVETFHRKHVRKAIGVVAETKDWLIPEGENPDAEKFKDSELAPDPQDLDHSPR